MAARQAPSLQMTVLMQSPAYLNGVVPAFAGTTPLM